jgi:uncharacterized membrane protein
MAAKHQAEKKNGKRKISTGSKHLALDDETLRNISKIVEIEEQQRSTRTAGERIATMIAAFCGSMFFVYVHIVWFALWILNNSVFTAYRFDPFPYTFLTLIVSLEAIFLSTFILISQNHENRLAEQRNQLDLQINMLAEQENSKMLELLQQIAAKVGAGHKDPEVAALAEPVEPERLVEQIMSATEDTT